MPEAGQEPDDKDVEKLAALFDPVSAQRDVDVIAEPGAEGDVPPAPEFGDAFGDVGVIEVLREEKAQHPSQTDCHQRVAAEVKVNLEAVGDDAHPGKRGGYLRKAERLHLGPQRADGVCQKNLAGKSHDEQAHALVDLRQGDLAALELPADVRVQDNRTGNQLREEHDEGAEVDQVVLHLDFAPVDIHRVGQNLEGVKADAQRQVELGGIQQRQAQPQQGIDVGQEEVCVLKEEQEAQRDEKGDPETSLARLFIVVIPLHQQSGNVVDADRDEHDGEKFSLAPGVKEQAGQKEHRVLCLKGHQVIDQKGDRKKTEQKQQAAKNQIVYLQTSFLLICRPPIFPVRKHYP